MPVQVEFYSSFGPKPCWHRERDESGCLHQETKEPISAPNHSCYCCDQHRATDIVKCSHRIPEASPPSKLDAPGHLPINKASRPSLGGE